MAVHGRQGGLQTLPSHAVVAGWLVGKGGAIPPRLPMLNILNAIHIFAAAAPIVGVV